MVPANGEATLGVSFDVAAWFTDEDGAALDPTDSGNDSEIESAIIDSISAAAAIELEDDGEDDD